MRYPTAATGTLIYSPVMFRYLALLLTISGVMPALAIDRRLYVTDKTGISVYDIDNGHKLVRKISIPGTSFLTM